MRYLEALDAIDHAAAQGEQKTILDTALAQVGFIPNMYANMANAPAVLGTYLHGYGLFRKESGLAPAEQEVVFLAASLANGCTYCVAAHSMMAAKVSGVPADVLQAIRTGAPIADEHLAALFDFTQELIRSNGRPGSEIVSRFRAAGYSEQQALYVVLAIAVKVLSNFTNHAFGTAIDSNFAAYAVS